MRSKVLTIFTALAITMAATTAQAAPTNCPEHFANGEAPDIINQKLTQKTHEICYPGFEAMDSGITRTPLYAAEHLTASRIMQAKQMRRESHFFAEPSLPAEDRAELHHYAHSGYDRGHMAPSGDMPNDRAQQGCFTLGNMIPQDPTNNRGAWEAVEAATRKMALQRGELYVLTGPLFLGTRLQRIGGAVMVPTHLFKAFYDPKRHETGAYLIENTASAKPESITVAELERIAGINLFPLVSPRAKSSGMDLLPPISYQDRRNIGSRGGE